MRNIVLKNGRSAVRTPFTKNGIPKRRMNAQKIVLRFMAFVTVVIVISYGHMINRVTRNDDVGAVPSTPRNVEEAAAVRVAKDNMVGYAVSVTGCGDEFLADGAAVLKHSVHLNSVHNPKSTSRYSYKMIAIVHPTAVSCSSDLETMGYEILVRDTPVAVSDIEGRYLRERVGHNGCCGEKEFVKLWAYTLTQFSMVVHLDVDTLILRPLDDLFDAMASSSASGDAPSRHADLRIMFDAPIPPRIDAFFTRDYNMVRPPKKVGMQGGFLVLRPSVSTFDEYKSIVRRGDFRYNGGWGGSGYGDFYGGMTVQGIVPYFYDVVRPNTAVELDRCYYNTMADNPRTGRTVDNVVSGECRDGTTDCKDCREIDVGEIKTAHFTLCQKPWHCTRMNPDLLQEGLCRNLQREWFKVRVDLEDKNGPGRFDVDQFLGFCKEGGERGYIPYGAS